MGNLLRPRQLESTGNPFANGSILESRTLAITSDGATITATVSATVGTDLTFRFSDGLTLVDFTTPKTVTLTAGSDTVPVENFLYFLKTDPTTLVVSSVNFPSVEHARIGRVIVQSPTRVQADGVLKQHDYTDHTEDTVNNGHVQQINDWIREQFATWKSDVAPTITGSGTGTVTYAVTSGIVKQLHDQAFPAIVDPADIVVINDFTTPYKKITNLGAGMLTDSTGASLTGKHYVLVVGAFISESGTGQSKMYVNLPNGSYNTQSQAEADLNGTGNFSIPIDFTGVGFLIQKLVMQNAGDTTFTVNDTENLRGQKPPISAGSSSAQATQFPDATFEVFNNADNTKELAFDASAITTATKRTITAADRNLNLATPLFDSADVDNINLNANTISTTNVDGDLNLEPNGNGVVVTTKAVYSGNVAIGGNAITTLNVGGDLLLTTLSNGDVDLSPNGTGVINLLKETVATTFNADNIKIDTNTISSTDTNGEMNLTPDGTGSVRVGNGNVTSNLGMLVLDGPVSSVNGPHIAAFVSGDNIYPALQIATKAHDEIEINFDMYWDGSAWRSSDAGSNFIIRKASDDLTVFVDEGIAQGDEVNFSSAFAIAKDGGIFAPLLLNSSGGEQLRYNTSTKEIFYAEPAFFHAYLSTAPTNVTGDGTTYTMPYNIEVKDVGGDYNNATGVFTAPEDRNYYFSASARISGMLAAHDRVFIQLTTSNDVYFGIEVNPFVVRQLQGTDTVTISISKTVFMDAGDTAKIDLVVAGGTLVIDINGTLNVYNHFTGGAV